jgi:hypothetical protein
MGFLDDPADLFVNLAGFYSKAFGKNQERYFVKPRMAFTISWIASCMPSALELISDVPFFSILP